MLPWRMGIIENGVEKFVHPTFIYESLVTLFIFLILMLYKNKRKFTGEITYIYLIIYSFARFFIENLRTDSLMLYNIRVSALVSVAICVGICSILIKNHIIQKKIGQNK